MTSGKGAEESGDCFGHPRGLLCLCFAEGWERFSFFGMQSLLVLYMTHQLLRPGHVEQVVGFRVLRTSIEAVRGPLSEAALASQLFGLYAGFVYLTPLIGGFLADRWLGRTLTVTAGALLMAAGHLLMAFEWSFLLALNHRIQIGSNGYLFVSSIDKWGWVGENTGDLLSVGPWRFRWRSSRPDENGPATRRQLIRQGVAEKATVRSRSKRVCARPNA